MLLQSYFQYTRWANNLIINRLSEIKRIEKIEYLFSHMLNTHRIWNARALGEQASVLPFDSIGRLGWNDVDAQNLAISIEILDAKKPEEAIIYLDTNGTEFQTTVQDIFLHLGNHHTHHRGMIVNMIREAGHVPPTTDYVAWERAGKPIVE